MPYIDENTKYEFVKFKDGKEVFAMVREVFTDDRLELHFPMNIQLAPAITGGVLVNLGPYVPFTTEDVITVEHDSILFRTSISKKFIDFYDEACTAWLNIREKDTIEIKSSRQVYEESKDLVESAMNKVLKRNFDEAELEFRDEYDEVMDEFEEKRYLLSDGEEPGPDDIIH
tara:strand:- start:3860 stop:4375 length:516 start_codon:yes stop_codon:yes gene_type:complete